MKIVTIIVTCNRLELLKECIRLVRKQTHRSDLLVINNGSIDGTEKWLVENQVLHVNQKNRGASGGFSKGISQALALGADFIWCMDDDTHPFKEDALSRLVEAAHYRPEGAYFASLVFWRTELHQMNRPELAIVSTSTASDLEKMLIQIKRSSFVSLFLNAKAVQMCGLPLEEMFIWYDDYEFTGRLLAYGPAYLVVNSHVQHNTLANEGPSFSSLNIYNINKYWYGVRNRVFCILNAEGRSMFEGIVYAFAYYLKNIAPILLKFRLRQWFSLSLAWSYGFLFRPSIKYFDK